MCRVSRYSPKFLVLPISRRNCSSTVRVRALTWAQVRCRRCMGAVPRAEMIDVKVEKLFMDRHFCCLSNVIPASSSDLYSRLRRKRSA